MHGTGSIFGIELRTILDGLAYIRTSISVDHHHTETLSHAEVEKHRLRTVKYRKER